MIEIALLRRRGAFTLDVDFALPFSGITGLMGPSGSGKSTLFACLAGHARPDRGRIAANGRILIDTARGLFTPPARRGIGIVFQDGLLFPHMSVRRNLSYGAKGREGALFDDLVAALELQPLLDRKPARLSGGERQRVAIGRTLMARPELLLLDEPVSALDPARRAQVMMLIERVQASTGTPMIYISHAAEEIRCLARTVVTLEAGRIAGIAPEPALRGGAPEAGPAPIRAGTRARRVAV